MSGICLLNCWPHVRVAPGALVVFQQMRTTGGAQEISYHSSSSSHRFAMTFRLNLRAATKHLWPTIAICLAIACADATSPAGAPAAPHTAATIRVISGAGQSGVVGKPLAQPVVVEVLDSAGQPAWGRHVELWGSALGDSGYAVTGSDGRATLVWVLGIASGSQSALVIPMGQAYTDSVPAVSAVALPASFDHASPWNALRPTYSNWLNSVPLTRSSLFAPRDTFNNATAWPADAQLVAPSAWTVSADTAVPPAGYVGVGVITVRAAGKTSSVSITRVDDLRSYNWTVSYSCVAPAGTPAVESPGDAPLDSIAFTGTSVDVAHGSDPDPQGGKLINLPEYRFYFRGTRTNYQADGTVVTFNVSVYRSDIIAQLPDTLVFPYAATSGSVTGVDVPVQPGPKPRYVGGSWCNPAFYSTRSPIALAAN